MKLIERLRTAAQEGREIIVPWDHNPFLFDEAADEIERLRAVNLSLRKQLGLTLEAVTQLAEH